MNGWIRSMPWVFVGIWSTGFVVARFGMPHAPPLSFLAWRYALSVLAFGVWIAAARAAWPRGRAQWGWLALTPSVPEVLRLIGGAPLGVAAYAAAMAALRVPELGGALAAVRRRLAQKRS